MDELSEWESDALSGCDCGCAESAVRCMVAEIEQLRAALGVLEPDGFGCNRVEVERDRFGLTCHVNGESVGWPPAAPTEEPK